MLWREYGQFLCFYQEPHGKLNKCTRTQLLLAASHWHALLRFNSHAATVRRPQITDHRGDLEPPAIGKAMGEDTAHTACHVAQDNYY